MLKRATIRAAVTAAKRSSPINDDPNFATLKRARVGSPVPVYSPTGEPAFWLVPFVVEAMACGYASVDLAGRTMEIAIFGATSADRASWIPAEFFIQPSERFLAEIKARHRGATLSAPVLSYDKTPAKWGWRVEIVQPDQSPMIAFVGPAGWYESQVGPKPENWEG